MPIRDRSLGEAADDESRRHDDDKTSDNAPDDTSARPEPEAGDTESPAVEKPPADDPTDDDTLPELPPRMPGGARIRARMAAVQAIYQWRMTGTEISALIMQFAREKRLRDLDRAYFEMLLRGVVHDGAALEAAFDSHLSRPASQLDPVESAILLLATYELRECPEIPFAAVINEATNLARIFGATDGHRFVNGVLDAVARDLRPLEIGRRRRSR